MADADAAALGLGRPEDAIVRAMLTLRDSAAEITANLIAPVILNPHTRLGRQIVLQESDWPLRAPVLESLHAQQSDADTLEDRESTQAEAAA